MSVTASTTTELPAVPSSAPVAASREPDDVEYPEGHWIAQSVWHGVAVGQARAALENHFRQREDVLVAMELVVYYERGNPKAYRQPDVVVVFGVGRGGNRSSYRLWEEGKAPDFVLEVASPSTADNDAGSKAREYARIGVREYWRLDPEGSMMQASLEGYVASGDRYRPVKAVGRMVGGWYLRSRVLGLDLRSQRRDGATVLVFRDPNTGEEFDGALQESERRRRVAERERRIAERERQAAENRARQEADQRRGAEKRVRAAEERASAAESEARQEAGLRRAAEERARALEGCVRSSV